MIERVEQALAWARNALAGASDSEPLDAALLLMHVMGVTRATLLAHPEMTISPEQQAAFQTLIEQRVQGVPVPYLIRSRAFYDRELIVTPDVLIPRSETEHLIEMALEWAAGRQRVCVVDAGTGSGAIAVTLAANLPQARVWAVDVSTAALDVARQNAERYGVTARITFVEGDLLHPLIAAKQKADLIAANLPYIAHDEMLTLDVSRYEPHLALDGGADGLDVIRRLLEQAPEVLAARGLLLMEIGTGQGERVRELAQAAFPGARVRVVHDYAGHERVVAVSA